MKRTYLLLTTIVLLMLVGCSSVTVKSDFDPEYNFGEFKTYRWASDKEVNPSDLLAQNPLVKKRIIASVDMVLAQKGFKQVESGIADVVIVVHAGSKEKMQVTQTGGGYHRGWYDPWWGPYGGTTHVSYYEEATLVVDMVAWETKELAWRGMATGTVKENQNADEQQERFNGIVTKIFDQYPPGSKL